ncbi:MAG: hypothetical protein R2777_08570 [Chitinophagales bacterium]
MELFFNRYCFYYVNNSPELDIPDFDICKNTPTLIGVSGISGASFSWSPAISWIVLLAALSRK